MSYTYVSSAVSSGTMLYSLMQMRRNLNTAQNEISSGRLEDPGAALGGGVHQSILLRQASAQFSALSDSNATVSTRLDTTQTALASLHALADTFQKALVSAPDSPPGREALRTSAGDNLRALQATLSQTLNGDALFGGQKTDAAPLADFFASPASSAKSNHDATFLAHFGFSQTSASVSTITSTQMQAYIDGGLASEFDAPAWKANWSSASDNAVRSRISPDETITTSVSANSHAMRQLAKVFAVMADTVSAGLPDGAWQTLKSNASRILGQATAGLSQLQATLGSAQNRITLANDTMKAASTTLNTAVNTLESVDPATASVRLNELQQRIEASYSLTARLQQLSLVKYL